MTWPVPEPEIDNRQTSGLTEQSGNPSRKIVGLQVPDVLQQSFLMALHRHSWTLIDRATSKSQQRRNLSISLLELAPRNFFVHDHNYFLFTVGLSSSFGEIAVLHWVFQLLFARPRSHKHWIWRRSRVEAGGRIHQRKTLELPSQIPSLLAALIRKSWGCFNFVWDIRHPPFIFVDFSLTLDLVFFLRDTSSSHLMLQVGGSSDCGSGLHQWILRCQDLTLELSKVATPWGGTSFHRSQIGGKTANRPTAYFCKIDSMTCP